MEKAYFKEYYIQERYHWWFLARLKILESKVKQFTNSGKLKILNVGVATGATSEMLMKYGEVTSIEYDQDCCDFLNNEVQIPVMQGSILELPFADNDFDLVCAFDVIEHVEEDQLGVDEMKRVCKSDGHVFVTVPAFMSLWSDHDVINHHFRRYIHPQLEGIFSDNGKIIYSSYFNTLLFLPILLARKVSNLFSSDKKEAESDFEKFKPGFLNSILYRFFLIENWFTSRSIKFPFGVSLLLIWKK